MKKERSMKASPADNNAGFIKLVSIGEHLFARENVVDSTRQILSAKLLKSFDGKEVYLIQDFDWSKTPVGRGICKYKNGIGLFAELKIVQGYDYRKKAPCLGCKISKTKTRKDGVEILWKGEITSIGMCSNNSDNAINQLGTITCPA